MPRVLWAFGSFMRHDWVFDVLADLKSYAMANGLIALAAKADEALQVAVVEIEAQQAEAANPAGGVAGGGFRKT
jgi:hypothetical protein